MTKDTDVGTLNGDALAAQNRIMRIELTLLGIAVLLAIVLAVAETLVVVSG